MSDDKSFGQQLYDELKSLGHGSIIFSMGYAAIQRLKTAEREEVASMFASQFAWDYETIQRIKQDSPEVLATYLAERHNKMTESSGVWNWI